jgi:hypothetical protein
MVLALACGEACGCWAKTRADKKGTQMPAVICNALWMSLCPDRGSRAEIRIIHYNLAPVKMPLQCVCEEMQTPCLRLALCRPFLTPVRYYRPRQRPYEHELPRSTRAVRRLSYPKRQEPELTYAPVSHKRTFVKSENENICGSPEQIERGRNEVRY